jgi:hypothetical protein
VRVGAPGKVPLAGVGRLVSTRSTECRPTAYIVGTAAAAVVVVVPVARVTVVVVRATPVVRGAAAVVDAAAGLEVVTAADAVLEPTAVVGAAGDTVGLELAHPPMSAAITAAPKSRRTGATLRGGRLRWDERASGVARSPRRPGPATWEEAPRCLLCR